jgi:crossover junction endodeoxyribonuclease RuvC
MIRAGIDPGQTGAISKFEGDTLVDAIPMPVIDGEIVTKQVMEYLVGVGEVFMEKVSAMPKQGVSSTFKFGRGYGKLAGIVEAMKIPLHYVTPQAWQKLIDKPAKSGKDAVASWVLRTFPGDSKLYMLPRCRKPNEGVCDAIGIGYYGSRRGVK